jgi:hypothetical protein
MVWMEDFDGRGSPDLSDEEPEFVVIHRSTRNSPSRLRLKNSQRIARSQSLDNRGSRHTEGGSAVPHFVLHSL